MTSSEQTRREAQDSNKHRTHLVGHAHLQSQLQVIGLSLSTSSDRIVTDFHLQYKKDQQVRRNHKAG